MNATEDFHAAGMDDDAQATASVTVWVLLVLIAALSFWCQAAVTEER